MSLVEKTVDGVSQADIDESYQRFPGEQGPARYGFLEGIRRERKACAALCDAAANDGRRSLEAMDCADHLACCIRLRSENQS